LLLWKLGLVGGVSAKIHYHQWLWWTREWRWQGKGWLQAVTEGSQRRDWLIQGSHGAWPKHCQGDKAMHWWR
jgi:hypothetical protein